uniref:Uncharacterized protein n=1 Tax=Anopheles minimus TaxID=112268 RepID=A0A182WPK8_9DIPT
MCSSRIWGDQQNIITQYT